jgi:RNA polymerase sigma factor (TIGR02999 family)
MSADSRMGLPGVMVDPTRGRLKAGELIPLVYQELRSAARRQLDRLNPANSFAPTSLVHEAYVRLTGKDLHWDGARHFYFAAARAMHDVLVERARAQASQKRGGGRHRLDLDKLTNAVQSPGPEILALSEALGALEQIDSRKHQIVMLRFFGGLTCPQCAAAINRSQRSVERDWRYARAWLRKRLTDDASHGGGDDT